MSDIDKLLQVMAMLRDPHDGCAWDCSQSFATIAPYTIEEAYEVADAIERADMEDLRDELGDLLFQVVFHARMAEEQGAFDFSAVVAAIVEKMQRRHPHIFSADGIASKAPQPPSWEQMKSVERAAKGTQLGALDGVAQALPALKRAAKLGKRAAFVGFDWPDSNGVLNKVHEELAELTEAQANEDQDAMVDELGDVLFSVANLARHLNVDPESALRQANAKFERRFRHMEAVEGAAALKDYAESDLDAAWEAAKTATD